MPGGHAEQSSFERRSFRFSVQDDFLEVWMVLVKLQRPHTTSPQMVAEEEKFSLISGKSMEIWVGEILFHFGQNGCDDLLQGTRKHISPGESRKIIDSKVPNGTVGDM